MVGQMGQFTRWHDGQNRVNEAQEIVCKTTPSCRFVSSTGLPSRGDRLHFSTNGARELGIRYVLGYVNLLKHPKDDGLKVQTSVAPMKEKEPEKASVSSTPSSSPPLEDKMHIYILAGASNMVGRDKPMSGDQFNQTHENVFAMTRNGRWVPASDPLHGEGGVGPGKSFGVTLANLYNKAVESARKKRASRLKRTNTKQAMLKEKQLKLTAIERSTSKLLRSRCPDIEVNLREGKIRFKKRINFLHNTSTVAPESRPMLDQTAFALSLVNDIIERDGKLLDLEPLRFEIAGHTHTSRAKARNPGTVRLSMSRAKAVMDFMIKEGVKAEYLSCKG